MNFSSLDGIQLENTMIRSVIIQYLYYISGVLGIPGNILAITVLLSSHHLRNKTVNRFIINQSLIDLGSGIYTLLMESFNTMDAISNDNIAQQLYCRLWISTYPFWVFAISSTYNLMFLTLERFLAITQPLSYDAEKVKKRLPYVLVMSWVCGLIFSYINFLISYAEDGACRFIAEYNPSILGKLMPIQAFFLNIAIPAVVMTYAYIKMGLTLRKSRTSTSTTKSNIITKKIRKAEINLYQTCLILMVLFVLCWCNNLIAVSLYVADLITFGDQYYQSTVVIIVFNSCLNPYVICIRYKEFQDQLIKLLMKNK